MIGTTTAGNCRAFARPPRLAYDSSFSYFAPPNVRRELSSYTAMSSGQGMHGEATLRTDGLRAALVSPDKASCEPAPARAACARLEAYATRCSVALAPCTVDGEQTAADAACIADCADKASCADIEQAQSGSVTFAPNNPYSPACCTGATRGRGDCTSR